MALLSATRSSLTLSDCQVMRTPKCSSSVWRSRTAAALTIGGRIQLNRVQEALRVRKAAVVVRLLGELILFRTRFARRHRLRSSSHAIARFVLGGASILRSRLNLVLGIVLVCGVLLLQIPHLESAKFLAVQKQRLDHRALRIDRTSLLET